MLCDDEVESVIASVQDVLSFHALGHSGVEVVGNVVELDNLTHDRMGIFGGVEDAGYKYWFVPAHK